ncbi:MAG: hypothetical protein M1419_08390 [Bacteroidetes bacterium]|nr:hypothetical protein [Bacteroidota bacterium]
MTKSITLILYLFLLTATCLALPQYSMLTGNKCINCHVNPNGSGIRNDLGWYVLNDVGLLNPEYIGLGSFYEAVANTNQFFDKKVIFGFDFRYETAMLGPSDNPARKFFGMQASPYLAIVPFDWLTIGGSYNFFYDNNRKYPGQKAWSAYVQIQPVITLPSLKAGFFAPPIGMRYDDHTVLVSKISGGGQTQLIPPDFAEFGAEINYDGLKWLSLAAGIFGSNSMAENKLKISPEESISIVDENKLSASFKASLWQRFFEDKFNLNLGASYYVNNDFKITALFFNAGMTDNLAFLSEILWTDKTDRRKSRNYIVGVTYQLLEALLLEARFEKAMTEDIINNETWKTNQYLIGLHIFPLPFLELRPEYRIFDREWAEGYQAQYAVQLHVFY